MKNPEKLICENISKFINNVHYRGVHEFMEYGRLGKVKCITYQNNKKTQQFKYVHMNNNVPYKTVFSDNYTHTEGTESEYYIYQSHIDVKKVRIRSFRDNLVFHSPNVKVIKFNDNGSFLFEIDQLGKNVLIFEHPSIKTIPVVNPTRTPRSIFVEVEFETKDQHEGGDKNNIELNELFSLAQLYSNSTHHYSSSTSYRFYNKFQPSYKQKEKIIKHLPVGDNIIEGNTLPTPNDIYFIVNELSNILYPNNDEQKQCFIKQLTKALFSIGQIIFNCPLMNIAREENFNLNDQDIGVKVEHNNNVDEEGKIEGSIPSTYSSLCDTMQFKNGFLKIILKAMIEARDYDKESQEFKDLMNIVTKIGTTDLNENDKLQIFKIGTELKDNNKRIKKFKINKYPRLDIKLLLKEKLNEKITVLDYIRRRMGFSNCLGTIMLHSKDTTKQYEHKVGERISRDIYNKLDNVSKLIASTGPFSKNYGGLLVFNSKMSLLKNKSNPLNRIQTKTIDESISNQVKKIHILAQKFNSNTFNHVDSTILKYCEKKRYQKYIEHKRIISNILNRFIIVLFKGDTLETGKLWNEITEIIENKIKDLGYRLLDSMSRINLIKKKKKIKDNGMKSVKKKYTSSSNKSVQYTNSNSTKRKVSNTKKEKKIGEEVKLDIEKAKKKNMEIEEEKQKYEEEKEKQMEQQKYEEATEKQMEQQKKENGKGTKKEVNNKTTQKKEKKVRFKINTNNNNDNESYGGNKFLLSMVGIENEMIDFRKKFIKIMNESLGDICFYVLYLQEFMESLVKIKDSYKLKRIARERILNNFRIKYGIDPTLLSSSVINRLMSKRKNSLFTLKKYIIDQTKKVVKNFDFEKFIEHFYPSSGKVLTRNIIDFVLNESEVVQEKLDYLMGNSSRNIVHIKSLKDNKFEIRDIGVWIPAIFNCPVKSSAKGIKRFIQKNIKKKLVLYNLFTGEIIPCLTRNKFSMVEKDIKDPIKNCINFKDIEDTNNLIQPTITKSNFNGLVIMGPTSKNNFKYMQLFADKLEYFTGKTYMDLKDYLSLHPSKLNEWKSSNLEIFLENYVENKNYVSNNKKFIMPVAIDYGNGIKKKLFPLGSKKFEVTKDIEDLNETIKNNYSTKKTLEEWASKGYKNKYNAKDLYTNYRKSLRDGYQGITGAVMKNILTELYKDYTLNREFKLSDYDKLVSHIRFDKYGGGLQSNTTKYKIDNELKQTIHNIEKVIEQNIDITHFDHYYNFLKKMYN